MVVVACGELTGPKSPETPINVTATLINPTTAEVRWEPSPQSDGVVSYNILRNGQKVGESGTTTYRDTGLGEKTTYKYTVSANCTGGILSDPSPESPAATVTTQDLTPPRIIVINPFGNQTGVLPTATVAVTFSEAMDPATINTTTFSLKVTDTGANIPGTVAYNTTTHVAEFTPASALPGGVSITVTVTAGAKDLAGNALLLTPGSPGTWQFFTADLTPPTVTATSPANGAQNASINTAVTVTFSEAMDASTINGSTITLRLTSNGASVGGSVTYNATTHVATFTPSGSLASGVNYTITVAASVKDVAGNQMGTTFQSTFTTGDTTPPTVTATIPVNGVGNVALNAIVSATFSKAMNASTLNTTTFTLKTTSGGTPVTGTVTYNAATFTATFTPSSSLAQGTNYTATITTGAQDTFGNALASNASWAFTTVDTQPPTVTSVSPADLSTNVATNTAINITFSEQMDASTINGTTITLKNTNTSAAVAGTVSYNSGTHVATFTPSAALANGTGYTVTVTTGVKDVAGNAMASQFTSSFTTIAAPDTTAPTVVSTYPANFDTEIPIDTAITVAFSEAMKPSTINSTNFRVNETVGGASVAGTVTYNTTTFTAKFKPTSLLKNNTSYTVTVTTGVQDSAGNALAGDKVFSFTTTKFPSVIATSPANNATGVAISAPVTATFSEAMDATTITVTTFSLKTTVGSVSVAGTVSYNASTHVATFTPTAPLAPGTGYTATITTGAKDTSGNALPSNYVFAFTTAP
jgi:methionine-rich copper-binding protein CopC